MANISPQTLVLNSVILRYVHGLAPKPLFSGSQNNFHCSLDIAFFCIEVLRKNLSTTLSPENIQGINLHVGLFSSNWAYISWL